MNNFICDEVYLEFLFDNQHIRLLVAAIAYQPWYSVFLSQQTSTRQAYQSRNQPANRLIEDNFISSFLYDVDLNESIC